MEVVLHNDAFAAASVLLAALLELGFERINDPVAILDLALEVLRVLFAGCLPPDGLEAPRPPTLYEETPPQPSKKASSLKGAHPINTSRYLAGHAERPLATAFHLPVENGCGSARWGGTTHSCAMGLALFPAKIAGVPANIRSSYTTSAYGSSHLMSRCEAFRRYGNEGVGVSWERRPEERLFYAGMQFR
jgi:hypothetical protein